jgi:hypothetical protein
MMPFHYVWLIWSMAFLVPWAILFAVMRPARRIMLRASIATALFGLSEPIFVPRYWNPPSLFELARRTGFDIESLVFSFAIGGIAMVLYNAVTARDFAPLPLVAREGSRHRWHRVALAVPFVAFVPLVLLPWNPIFAALVSLTVGAAASVVCRPDLAVKTAFGGFLFLLLYWAFMLALRWSAPGYIETVWNLPDLTGALVGGIPIEELLFGFTFGMYWASVYEHVTWHAVADQDAPQTRASHASQSAHH